MKTLLLILSLMVATNSIGQRKLTDTTVIYGIISKNNVRGYSSECSYMIGDPIEKGSILVIAGAAECDNSKKKYYYTVYNHALYYIEKESILTEGDYYSQLLALNGERAKAFRDNAIDKEAIVAAVQKDRVRDFLEKSKPKGIVVLNWDHFKPEYSKSTSVELMLYNPTSKIIKYVWTTFTAFNPVGDKISSKTVKGVGPIRPNHRGKYTFEYVWFTDLVQTVRAESVKVQYMDGTFKTINDVSSISLPTKYLTLIDELFTSEEEYN